MRLRVVRQVALTSLREYLRTPEAIIWTYGFPLLMAMVLGLAFSSAGPQEIRVVIPEGSAVEFHTLLEGSTGRVQFSAMPEVEAERALSMGAFDLLLRGSPRNPTLRMDASRPGSELARFHVERILRGDPAPETVMIEAVTRPGARYIDFLIPGLIGLNLLGAGMFGVGANLVDMRVRNLLRRLTVTPMSRAEFFLGFLSSRLLLSLPAPVVVAVFGWATFGVPLAGSWITMLLLILLGAFAFSGMGLLVASRVRTIEGLSGLANLVMMPMWLLGGCFFSNERFPELVQPLVQLMPLTHFNDALRDVMLGGAGMMEVAVPMAILFTVGLLCFALALRIFRWD